MEDEDTSYDLLLKQQQLYLQWQLENQNKVRQKWKVYSEYFLTQVMLFHSRGRGKPWDGVIPILLLISNSSIIGLSNDVSFVSDFLQNGWVKWQNVWLKT